MTTRTLRAQSHLVTARPQPSTTTPKHYCHLKVIAGNNPIAKTLLAEQMAQLAAVNAASSQGRCVLSIEVARPAQTAF